MATTGCWCLNKTDELKYFIIIVSVSVASCTGKAYLFTSFHEPASEGLRLLYSYDGYHWTDVNRTFLRPETGSQRVMRDPSLIQDKAGVFHLVWTSSWRGDKGFGYASSKDLLHWSAQQFIPVMKDEPGTVNVWAPEWFYDDVQRQYGVVWASCIPGRYEKGLEEDSNNHRLYYSTTTNFSDFSPAKLFFDPGFSTIDAVIIKRSNKGYVLVLKDNTRKERDIKVAFAGQATGPYGHVSAPFTPPFTEGPAVLRLKDQWLIYYDAYRDKKYGAASTKDFVHFDDISNKIQLPEGHKHGTILPVKKKWIKKLLAAG